MSAIKDTATPRPPLGAQHPELDAHLIATRIWQGAHPPQGVRLRELGISFAVFAAPELHPSAASFPDVIIAHAVLEDDFEHALSERAFDGACEVARRAARHHRDANGTLYVSCSAGQNRSGLMTALLLSMLAPKTPIERIVKTIQRRRPGALTNPRFVEALLTRL